MTANQINFYKAKQDAKHYRRADKENKRHNVASEGLEEQRNLLTEWYNKKQAEIGFGNMQANQYQADVAGQRALIESRKQTLEEAKEYGNEFGGSPVSYRLKQAEVDLTGQQANKTGYETGKIRSETGLINSQISLTDEQAKTQKSQRISNYGKGVQGFTYGLSNVYRMVDGILEKVGSNVPGEVSVLHPN